jgi:DNA-binding NarL/FixJ family response regulator
MIPVSVLLIDANATFLRIATRLLQEYYSTELMLVGTSAGDADALQQAQTLQPRIILLGLSQHSLTALRLIPRLRAIMPDVGIIVLGALDIHAYHQAAHDAGADAFVAKVALSHNLLPTIASVSGISFDHLPHARARGREGLVGSHQPPTEENEGEDTSRPPEG